MAEKELRKMSRTELIEIIYALESDEARLEQEKEKLKEELNDRKIRIQNVGSIAEAALGLNKVFETAEAAAKDYLESVKEVEVNSRLKKKGAEEILSRAKKEAREILEEAQKEAEEILKKAKEDAKIKAKGLDEPESVKDQADAPADR